MKRIKDFHIAVVVMIVAVTAVPFISKAQSVHNEQYIALQNYITPSYSITIGAPITLASNYTFLLPANAPTGINQTLQVTSMLGSVYTLGWSSQTATNSWMLQGNLGLTDGVSNYLGTLDATPIRFITNGITNERMRISSTGQVGIGTASPGQLLEIKGGNLLLSNSGTAGQLQLQGTGTGVTTFASGAQGTTNINYTMPIAQGAAATFLKNNGSGVLSWDDLSSNIGAVKFAIKSSDETVSSTTLHDDNTLSFTIGANETWELIAQLDVATTDDDNSKFSVAITIPSGTLHVYAHGAGGDNDEGDWLKTSGTANDDGFEIEDDDNGPVELRGLIVGGSTGGTVHIQWAPIGGDDDEHDNTGSATVKTNSYLKATRAK